MSQSLGSDFDIFHSEFISSAGNMALRNPLSKFPLKL